MILVDKNQQIFLESLVGASSWASQHTEAAQWLLVVVHGSSWKGFWGQLRVGHREHGAKENNSMVI